MIVANTTIISNFASVGRLDLLRSLLDTLFISTDVLAEISDGYAEGKLFYRNIEAAAEITDGNLVTATATLHQRRIRR